MTKVEKTNNHHENTKSSKQGKNKASSFEKPKNDGY